MKIQVLLDGSLTSDSYDKPSVSQSNDLLFHESSELKEAVEEINKDVIDDKTNMSSIDLRCNLTDGQFISLAFIDALVSMKIFPQDLLPLTRQIKRLSVSKDGKGREQIVDMVSGNRSQKMLTERIEDMGKSFISQKARD